MVTRMTLNLKGRRRKRGKGNGGKRKTWLLTSSSSRTWRKRSLRIPRTQMEKEVAALPLAHQEFKHFDEALSQLKLCGEVYRRICCLWSDFFYLKCKYRMNLKFHRHRHRGLLHPLTSCFPSIDYDLNYCYPQCWLALRINPSKNLWLIYSGDVLFIWPLFAGWFFWFGLCLPVSSSSDLAFVCPSSSNLAFVCRWDFLIWPLLALLIAAGLCLLVDSTYLAFVCRLILLIWPLPAGEVLVSYYESNTLRDIALYFWWNALAKGEELSL